MNTAIIVCFLSQGQYVNVPKRFLNTSTIHYSCITAIPTIYTFDIKSIAYNQKQPKQSSNSFLLHNL